MFYAAFLLGIFGSLHCVGMCGAIALALPLSRSERRKMIAESLLYNFGRVGTYTLLGFLLGFIGKGAALAGVQKFFSIGVGFLLIVVALFVSRLERFIATAPIFVKLQQKIGQLLRKPSATTALSVGFLNGFIPCGLVYSGITSSLLSGNPINGAAYMFFFGFGTVPLMLSFTLFGRSIPATWRKKASQALPIFLILIGISFIYRALHLDIVAILTGVPNAELNCH